MPPFCFDFSKFSGGERRAFGARRTRLADRNLLLLPPIILYKLSAYTSFQPSYATAIPLSFPLTPSMLRMTGPFVWGKHRQIGGFPTQKGTIMRMTSSYWPHRVVVADCDGRKLKGFSVGHLQVHWLRVGRVRLEIEIVEVREAECCYGHH